MLAPASADRVAVSYNDLVLYQSDGTHWATVFAGRDRENQYVRDVQWIGKTHLFVAATDGVFRSDFGDSQCFTHQLSTRSDVQRLDFLDLRTGWAISGSSNQLPTSWQLMKTPDGGVTWVPVATGLPDVQWVQFVDSRTGYAAGSGGVVRTTDGGLSWKRGLVLDANRMRENSGQVAFIDSTHGFAYYRSQPAMNQASANIWYTADGGQTWALEACSCGYVSSPYGKEAGAKASIPSTTQTQLAVTGQRSAALMTWSPAGAQGGTTSYCTSGDAGRDWSCRDVPGAYEGGADLGEWGPRVAWAMSGNVLLQTVDGGATWRKVANFP